MPDNPESRDPQALPRQTGGDSAGEFTQMFASLTPPAQETSESKTPAAKPSEFTQIFTPLAPPASAPKELRQAQVPDTQPGEFTQFFSAISSREASSRPQPTPSPQDVDATAVFETLQQPEPAARQSSPSTPQKEAGAFTQLFQQIQAPPAATPPINAVPFQAPARQVPTSEHPPMVPAAPAFGAPPAKGSFTDIFQAQPLASSQPPASAPSHQSGAFTDFFQAAPSATSASPDPFARVPQNTPPSQFASPAPVSPSMPAYAPSAAPPAASGGGDFTRLMQSLEHPSGAGTPAQFPQTSPMQGDPAFFSTPYATAGAGESEYTRVLRGGSVRDHAGVLPAAPVPGSSVAPGLAIAPPKQEEKREEKQSKKPSPVVLLLIVMNVLLVIILIVAATVFLRHK